MSTERGQEMGNQDAVMWTSTEDGIAKRRGVNRGKTLQSPRSRSCPLWEHWCLSWEHFTWCQMRSLVIFKWVRGDQGGGWMWSSPLPKNRSKLHVEQFSQNTHWMLAEELITTKTQERLPCNWVKIKVFFKNQHSMLIRLTLKFTNCGPWFLLNYTYYSKYQSNVLAYQNLWFA